MTSQDIFKYSGDGLIPVTILAPSSDIDEIKEILSKFKRKVSVLPIEEFGVIDSKARLQLKDKQNFIKAKLGLGSFYKTLREKGRFKELANMGVKYVYFQPLNNLFGKIIDFDMLDIILSSTVMDNDPSIMESLYSSENLKTYNPKSKNIGIQRANTTHPKKRSKRNIFDIFGNNSKSSNQIAKQNKIANKNNTLNSSEKLMRSNSFFESQASIFRLDCISKVFDSGGDIAFKIHEDPNDSVNPILFANPERRNNFVKLHSGESIFSLDLLNSFEFRRSYNYSNPLPLSKKVLNLSTINQI